jgi:hypothetical protein
MQVGGNENARNFFKDKGWSDVSAKVREAGLLVSFIAPSHEIRASTTD